MANPRITIIGLGTTGTSLGLALARSGSQVEIVGHDKIPEVSQQARKLNAIARAEWNLHRAVEGAAVVVLAIPQGEIAETLDHIREDIPPATLVFVLSAVFAPTLTLLTARLPGHVNAVVGQPILNPLGGAGAPSADLLAEAVFCLAAGAETSPDALGLASDFVAAVGAQPLYVDPAEHDGLVAEVELLPDLLGAALMHMAAATAGWTEARRVAGVPFARAARFDRSAASLGDALLANRENVVQRLTQYERALAAWKQWLLAEPDAAGQHPLRTALAGAEQEWLQWQHQAQRHQWEEGATPPVEKQPGMMRQLFLGGMFGKRAEKPGSDADRR